MKGKYQNIYGTVLYVTGIDKHKKVNYVLGHTEGGHHITLKESEFNKSFTKIDDYEISSS